MSELQATERSGLKVPESTRNFSHNFFKINILEGKKQMFP